MGRIDTEILLPNERLREMVANGTVSQLHRGHRYAGIGDTFELRGEIYEVTAVDERTLGDLTDEDARAEGSTDLDAYRERLERAHDSFEWDEESPVVRHRFERA